MLVNHVVLNASPLIRLQKSGISGLLPIMGDAIYVHVFLK